MPHTQTLDKAEKACQEQTLLLTGPRKRFYEDHYRKIFTGHGVVSSGSTYDTLFFYVTHD